MAAKGRPQIYRDNTKVRLAATGQTKLQSASDRRAVVDALVDLGGVATLEELDNYFSIPVRPKVVALMRAGWIEVIEDSP